VVCPEQKCKTVSKNKWKVKGLGHGSTGRVIALQVWGPEFNPSNANIYLKHSVLESAWQNNPTTQARIPPDHRWPLWSAHRWMLTTSLLSFALLHMSHVPFTCPMFPAALHPAFSVLLGPDVSSCSKSQEKIVCTKWERPMEEK
jgi:hypothetical protein